MSWEAWNALEDVYDGTIRQADSYLESLVAELRSRDSFDDTLLVITSDHGEGFGEYSRVRPEFRIAGHIVGLHESLLHVPLIVSYPGQTEGTEVTELSTLRKFPNAVEAALAGDWTGDEFVPDGPVVASASTIDRKKKNAQRAGTYCEDLSPYRGPIRAVYRTENGTIRKHLLWGDDAVTVEIEDAQTARTVSRGDPKGEVESVFETMTDADVTTRQDDVGAETMDHLESLGYV